MRAEGDTVFVQMRMSESDHAPLRLEFEVGPDGRATAVRHNIDWRKDNPLIRLGDLPPAYVDPSRCQESPRR